MEEINVLTDEVKTYCKQKRCHLDSSSLFAEFAPAYHRWYDADTLEKGLRDALGETKALKLIESTELIVTREEVDEKVLKSLIKLEKIPEDVAKAAARQEETQVRVTIKDKT